MMTVLINAENNQVWWSQLFNSLLVLQKCKVEVISLNYGLQHYDTKYTDYKLL